MSAITDDRGRPAPGTPAVSKAAPAPAGLTVVRNAGGRPLSKSFSWEGGRIVATPAAQMADGEGRVLSLGPEALAARLNRMPVSQAVVLGVPKAGAERFGITTKDRERPGATLADGRPILARTKANFDFPEGPAWMGLDFDTGGHVTRDRRADPRQRRSPGPQYPGLRRRRPCRAVQRLGRSGRAGRGGKGVGQPARLPAGQGRPRYSTRRRGPVRAVGQPAQGAPRQGQQGRDGPAPGAVRPPGQHLAREVIVRRRHPAFRRRDAPARRQGREGVPRPGVGHAGGNPGPHGRGTAAVRRPAPADRHREETRGRPGEGRIPHPRDGEAGSGWRDGGAGQGRRRGPLTGLPPRPGPDPARRRQRGMRRGHPERSRQIPRQNLLRPSRARDAQQGDHLHGRSRHPVHAEARRRDFSTCATRRRRQPRR